MMTVTESSGLGTIPGVVEASAGYSKTVHGAAAAALTCTHAN